MKVGFAYNHGISSKLTKFWTGSSCYHVFFVDLENDKMHDMNLLRRRRVWTGQYDPKDVILVDAPVAITPTYLEYRLDVDDAKYGVFDYCLFALRPLFHLFGKSTPNKDGVICSEMVYNDLRACGWTTVFPEVPSPADLEVALLGRKDAIHGLSGNQ